MGGKLRSSGIADLVRSRIRQRRLEIGLTQEQLCERAGISIDAVSRIESGQRVPSLTTLESLAKGLGVSVVFLIQQDEPSPVNAELEVVIHRLHDQPPEVIAAAGKMVTALVEVVSAQRMV